MLKDVSHDPVLGLRARHRELPQHSRYSREVQPAAMGSTKQEAGKSDRMKRQEMRHRWMTGV